MRYTGLTLLLLFFILQESCAYDTALLDCRADQNTPISFRSDVFPLVNNTCNECHSESNHSGGIILSDYQMIKIFVDNGEFYNSIYYTDNAISMMPIGGKLTACELKAIKSWIDHQSPDN